MNKCGGCGKFLTGGATCSICKALYHKQCVNLTTTPKQWSCPCCAVKAPRKDNTNTPVKSSEVQGPDDSPRKSECEEQNLVLEEIRALRSDMKGFRTELGCFREEVRNELRDLRALYTDCTGQLNEFSERLDSYDSKLVQLEASYKESKDLKKQVIDLKQELNNKEQLSMQNDLEISGVTEHKGENIMHVTSVLLNKVSLKVDEHDIVDARRVGPVRVGQDGKERPRPIVLRLARRAVHEQVLRCARARRTITTGDIELAGTPRPVYINERLTRENRLLFNKARLLCKQHSWKYAWAREGRILVRECEGKTAFRVRNENDFDRIFK